MQFDLQTKLFIKLAERGSPKPMTEQTPQEMRAAREIHEEPNAISQVIGGPSHDMHMIIDQFIDGRNGPIQIRAYQPTPERDVPLVMLFHGGGWVVGNINDYDAFSRRIAHESGAIVVAVEYRLAPEHKFPAALEDCYDATVWAAENINYVGGDIARLVVMGDSAGGNLAAAVSLMARDLGGPAIKQQILIYPVTDGTCSMPSHQTMADAPILSSELMRQFVSYYASVSADVVNPYFSPYFADDVSNQPDSLVITAEYDPLCDEGRAYAEKLIMAGNNVNYTQYPKSLHGFLSFPGFAKWADAAYKQIGDTIRWAGRDKE